MFIHNNLWAVHTNSFTNKFVHSPLKSLNKISPHSTKKINLIFIRDQIF